ncbi:mannosyl-oligosaccharide 1,2-alpha-mannosidase IA-like [Pollicipes pollicipes]|uniref:mannosyl-oligosaccharide 1,2-alpha-mannosidase IA-like n=1 Tax=Pollicipes pollicipes TaxID=41117 RepID=UPI0018859ED5|nr:mannosyl-oligosaccharide 1,2-alpha-mannosidase IA-like [Pollicipes pollicipes]XP_037081845.1 mannosyl-oligosaccharide 1,2-alpha-mannosidase IA-like [Pollicipes pollicipes]
MGVTDDILPRFQRLPAAGAAAGSRQGFRCRETHIFLAIGVTIVFICFGTIFFLPDLGESIRRIDSLGRVQKRVQDTAEGFLLPPPPHADEAHENLLLRHDGNQIEDPHVVQDRQKLYDKVRSAGALPPPPLAKPRHVDSGDVDNVEVDEVEPPAAPAAPAPADGGGSRETVAPLVIGDDEDPDPVMRHRRDTVKKMMEHAWKGYQMYAWGSNELRPVSKRGHSAGIFGRRPMGATIVDAMDTLYIMGMTEQFAEGRRWIQEHLDASSLDSEVSIFEMNIRYVGGLLSCFAMTGDVLFRDKAHAIARALLPGFNTPTGIPYSLVVPTTGRAKNYGWASGASSILSEFGTLHMEFSYLSDVTGDPEFRKKVERIRQVVRKLDKPNGLYPNYLNPKTGKWGQRHMSVGALGDSFYEYLLKEWIRSGGEDVEALEMFHHAIGNITQRLLKKSKVSGLTYIAEMQYERPNHKMDHLACFIGGLYALAAVTDSNKNSEQYARIGAEITHTCHESYDRTATKLGPENFRFSDAIEAKAMKMQEKYYILRPEVIESYFVLWRMTGDKKYREWGWEAAQAIERHCRAEAGYSGIQNVESSSPRQDDVQQSYFLAETLKYLYLLFSDKSLMPLDEWVLNTEAHPLPIRGANPLYREWRAT